MSLNAILTYEPSTGAMTGGSYTIDTRKAIRVKELSQSFGFPRTTVGTGASHIHVYPLDVLVIFDGATLALIEEMKKKDAPLKKVKYELIATGSDKPIYTIELSDVYLTSTRILIGEEMLASLGFDGASTESKFAGIEDKGRAIAKSEYTLTIERSSQPHS